MINLKNHDIQNVFDDVFQMINFDYFVKFCKNVGRRLVIHRKYFVILVALFFALYQLHHYFPMPKDNGTLKKIAEKWLKIDTSFEWSDKRFKRKRLLVKRNISIDHILNGLPSFHEHVHCPILFNPRHPKYKYEEKKASAWKYNVSELTFWKEIEEDSSTNDICATLKNKYAFFTEPLSLEEFEFPIAYGMLVVKDIRQITFMLSAFYQPQNAYCIAIDGKATNEFKRRMALFQQCFPNIHVFNSNANVSWCGPEIPPLVLSCIQKLNEREHPWKYYQYLSGVDLPLKTNLEMVRIFKALNGTFNANVHHVFPERYLNRGTLPMPIWVSSLSALFSRASANVIANHPKVYKLLKFLQKTDCSDESLWATIAGNPEYIKMPGGFSSKKFHAKIQSEISSNVTRAKLPKSLKTNSFQLRSFYISRHQVWERVVNKPLGKCAGTWKSGSCIFGAGDLSTLLVRPELVAHKFYIDKHPAAFFCLYHKIRQRSLDFKNQQKFDASNYANLPQVQISQGKSIDDVKFLF